MRGNWRIDGVGRRWAILSLVLTLMLFAGLRPRGFPFHNTASLHPDPPGLAFGDHGLAFTRTFIRENDARTVARDGLTLVLEIEVADDPPDGFAAIAVLHNGNDAEQLFLGQYQRHLVLMNGDDYNHQRRLPRVSVNTAKHPPGRLRLWITSDLSGSVLRLNGETVASRADFIQTVPVHGRLTLGNAPDGKHPWNGTLHRFALYQTSRRPGPPEEGNATPWLDYRFDLEAGRNASSRRAPDLSGHSIDLEFPLRTTFLQREFLGPGTVAPYTEEITSRDGLINFFGFIPLGWIVAGLIGSRPDKRAGALTRIASATAAGFVLSLTIEYLQTWIPTRSSSLLDLILNTAGAFLGAALCLFLSRRGSAALPGPPAPP